MIRHTYALRRHTGGLFARSALCACSLVVIIAMGLGAKAHAASDDTIGFAVSPPTFEISANPGDTIRHSMRVDNLTKAPLHITITGKDFVPMGEEGQAALTEKKTNYSLASWVTTSTKVLDIPVHGSKTVDFTIAVPTHAEPGGHFGSIVFQTKPDKKPNSTGVAVGQEIGSLLLLKVAGHVSEKASIASFGATKGVWQKGPIYFNTRVKNDGNVQIKPTGTITISNMFGGKVGTVPIDSQTILPDSIRKLRANWNGSTWPGWYTATASISYGNSDQILTTTTRFLLFPYRIILPVIAIIAVVGLYVFRARKRLWRAVRILAGKD